MTKHYIITAIFLLVFLLIIVLPSIAGMGDYTDSTKIGFMKAGMDHSIGADKVKIGFWLANLEKYDVSTGIYDVDFYVWLNWSGDISPNLEFMNGHMISTDIIESHRSYLEMRIRSSFIKLRI